MLPAWAANCGTVTGARWRSSDGLRVPAEHLAYVVVRFPDAFRRMGALRRPFLTYHPQGVSFPEELRAAQRLCIFCGQPGVEQPSPEQLAQRAVL